MERGAALLRFDQVACRRGGRLLFEGIDLVLNPGGVAIVRGPNGIGKSSLLRVAAGLLPAAAGRVERSTAAALADDRLALDERLTLGDALGFWAELDRVSAAAGLAAMGLDRLAAVPVRMLSTGQRKRATLARVIASPAGLWLLDEPANGLDGEALDRLAGAIARHRAEGGAVLAASHQSLGLADVVELLLA